VDVGGDSAKQLASRAGLAGGHGSLRISVLNLECHLRD
jgi:hypothetical protein